MRYLSVLLLLISMPAWASDTSWHFLSQSYGGTISLVKNLTKDECEFMYNRAKNLPATADERAAAKRIADEQRKKQKIEDEKWQAEHPQCDMSLPSAKQTSDCWHISVDVSGSTYAITSGDIKYAECFQ